MVAAGDTVIAGRVPGERVGSTKVTASSAAITSTETVVVTVTAPVVQGRTYEIRYDIGFAVSIVTDVHLDRVREDNVSGTTLQSRRLQGPTTASPWPHHGKAEYTADVTETKTFVLTLQRTAGTGNITMAASATSPAFLDVYYVAG